MSAKEELLEKQKELVGGNFLEFPFTKIKIDHEKGQWRVGGEKNQETGEWENAVYQEQIEFVFLKRYSEYFYFDGEKEQITKRTTIEEKAGDCVELFSRVPVSDLKEAGYKMTYLSHLIGLLKQDQNFICADLPLKGSGFKSFLDFTSEEKDYLKNRLLYKLVITLEKKRKGVITYYVPVFAITEISEEEAKQILKKTDKCIEEFEEFRKAYNSRTQRKNEVSEELPEEIDTIEDEDGELPF